MFLVRWYLVLVSIVSLAACSYIDTAESMQSRDIPRALLATRFQSLADFENTVSITYVNTCKKGDTCLDSKVVLSYSDAGYDVRSELKSGVSQRDIMRAKDGDLLDKASLVWNTPYGIRSRVELSKIHSLARILPDVYGYGDVAFYNLAEASMRNIITPDLAFFSYKDSSEKGYINTFNHVTAQTFITTLFSEEVADYIADVHELKGMPQLTSGLFTPLQLTDTVDYPVDNYVDMVNNELGQELGKKLKQKYNIKENTHWTPELMADFLNDIQSFYMWSFGIGMRPFTQEQKSVIVFSNKINRVMLKE